ncbi:hypothetical protein LUZ63_016339 [Rhynchospora breviuscula]|uniref:Protein kinase domain-containing protein n=1 Tax=Rhynchospora breviuscula TaxID=2022672 RepID=A0A9Q0C0Y4_9POAL|nr:hypothetical protein LUZ63_016339 [Rhynchospora breviuscula]
MATLANYVILFFLLFPFPCFSSSCQTTLPCNNPIQIRPPFFIHTPDSEIECGKFLVLCEGDIPYIYIYFSVLLPLESITYGVPNTVRVKDPSLSRSLQRSNCSNIYFDFPSPVNNFRANMYSSLNTSFSSIRCNSTDLIQSPPNTFRKDYNLNYSTSEDEKSSFLKQSPPNTFRKESKDYNLNYSTTGDEKSSFMKNCLNYNSSPSFELTFSVNSDNQEISLLSASYSNHLLAKPGCFAKSTLVFACDRLCKAIAEKQFPRKIIIVLAMAGTIMIIFVFLLSFRRMIQRYRLFRKNRPQENIVSIIEQHGSFAPIRYRYVELKKITNSFHNKLGKGGFGSVFKGNLENGRFVAVKLLHDSSGTGEEFVNEVISIGRTSHANIVGLIGFCIEKSYRALIYEYMPNGSLDKYIYSENSKENLEWEKLYDIAVGVARGLEYLHRGCSTRIVHFDIKPQNILLDEDFCPKIADFGLAKLCPPKESIISLAEMRGTIGYIAPEVFSRNFGVVSTKSDVYSYGMMVLEMVGGRRNAKSNVENSSQEYFPHWIYDRLAKGADIKACNTTIQTEDFARKMALVGLWCTQTIPSNRPSMGRVLELFERRLDELEMPPKPYLASPPHHMMSLISSSS